MEPAKDLLSPGALSSESVQNSATEPIQSMGAWHEDGKVSSLLARLDGSSVRTSRSKFSLLAYPKDQQTSKQQVTVLSLCQRSANCPALAWSPSNILTRRSVRRSSRAQNPGELSTAARSTADVGPGSSLHVWLLQPHALRNTPAGLSTSALSQPGERAWANWKADWKPMRSCACLETCLFKGSGFVCAPTKWLVSLWLPLKSAPNKKPSKQDTPLFVASRPAFLSGGLAANTPPSAWASGGHVHSGKLCCPEKWTKQCFTPQSWGTKRVQVVGTQVVKGDVGGSRSLAPILPKASHSRQFVQPISHSQVLKRWLAELVPARRLKQPRVDRCACAFFPRCQAGQKVKAFTRLQASTKRADQKITVNYGLATWAGRPAREHPSACLASMQISTGQFADPSTSFRQGARGQLSRPHMRPGGQIGQPVKINQEKKNKNTHTPTNKQTRITNISPTCISMVASKSITLACRKRKLKQL